MFLLFSLLRTYREDLLFRHAPLNVRLVRKHEEACSCKTLCNSSVNSWPLTLPAIAMDGPLPREVPAARLCSPRYATDPLRPQPRSGHLSSQNNSSSMTGVSSDHQHPLTESAMVFRHFRVPRYTQMLSLYLGHIVSTIHDHVERPSYPS